MEAKRVQVKVYAAGAVPTERLIPVFHRWIREKTLDELALDVADYGHVHEGPGVVLIGQDKPDFRDVGKLFGSRGDAEEGKWGFTQRRKGATSWRLRRSRPSSETVQPSGT